MYAIEAKNIAKAYRLYRKPVDRLKEALFRRPFHESFESLRDVSFSIAVGDSIGIVGENGAGKTTLFKILAGTSTPSSGEVIVNGRVTALLELGTGFHPEFSGRQNIYLNASLLGLSQSEIKEKEPKIIGFAEIGPFIDRPIKTYSTGMVMRLAFSIATSVDPDMLIIDEALSVGDQYFQQKCIDKMLSFREQGKTILFCSHSMHLVNKLCNKAIWLNKGSIQKQGIATRITSAYADFLRAKMDRSSQEKEPGLDKIDSGASILIKAITLNGQTGPITLKYREDLNIVLEFESFGERPFWVALGIKRNDELLCHAVSMARDISRPLKGKGTGKVLLSYRSLPLMHGQYVAVGFIFDESGLHCYHTLDSAPFTIIPPVQWRQEQGLMDLDHEWKILRDLK
ncbi:MAG: ABC transporter ATP-binding protein [Deltaproteobacteria bacterium]|nr:ABC transporter ATP-binding protein [Deltaproteobacteria bacterium]MBL7218280.1 ABC transporter ATP-binding protein [Desulfobacteraceae bacterium]